MAWFDLFRRKKKTADRKAVASGGTEQAPGADDLVASDHRAVIPGSDTQFPETAADAPRRQFVIGLDFGTAFTKVVIGETSKAYAVPFSEYAIDGNPYLLPGVLSMSDDGLASLGAGNAGVVHSDLKMRFLDGDTGEDTKRLTATFLALVLRHARAWFLNEHRDDYRQFRLDWCVNVGLPTHQYHDDTLKDFYREIVRAAWRASIDPGPISTRLIADCFEHRDASLADSDIGLFPEFVAQVNSYVKSPQRQPDLHLLVDVGAGTVDVAVFNVHENDQGDLFPIFAKSVSKYGVNFLQRSPSESDIRELVWKQIRNDIEVVRTEKYPEFWRYGKTLPFFLCGGGSQVDLYRKLAAEMVRRSSPCILRSQELPMPPRLNAAKLPEGSYHRLSVAYGLSFDVFDIGQIVPEHRTADKSHDGNSRYNEVCRACNGSGGARGNDCYRCDGRGWIQK